MLQSILFTHTDLDGAGCSILFDLLMRSRGFSRGPLEDYMIVNSQIFEIDYTVINMTEEYADPETEIIFADLCCSEDCMEYLVNNFNSIKVYDHHKSNTWVNKMANDHDNLETHVYENNEYNMSESGTSILWSNYRDELSNPIIIKFVNAIRSYDTFEFKHIPNDDAVFLNTYFVTMGMKKFCEVELEYLEELLANDHSLLNDTGSCVYFVYSDLKTAVNIPEIIDPNHLKVVHSILANQDEKIQRIVDSDDDTVFRIVTKLDGMRMIVFNLIPGINMSELAARYLAVHCEYKVFAWFDINHGGLSFRTIYDNIDVTKIADKFNGGGHPKAAGGKIPPEVSLKIADAIKSIFK